MSSPKRKISLVFEEDETDKDAFKVYLDGDCERIAIGCNPETLSDVEFWASCAYSTIANLLKQEETLEVQDKKGMH